MEKVIESLISDYSNWRSTKPAKKARIPKHLIKKTIEVKNQFPEVDLKSLLGLSVPSWKKINSQVSIGRDNKQVLSRKKTKSKKTSRKFLKLDSLEPSFTAQGTNNHFVNKTPALVMSINNIQIQIFG